jgi:hypothetical protein
MPLFGHHLATGAPYGSSIGRGPLPGTFNRAPATSGLDWGRGPIHPAARAAMRSLAAMY